jgi:hypothetical protein
VTAATKFSLHLISSKKKQGKEPTKNSKEPNQLHNIPKLLGTQTRKPTGDSRRIEASSRYHVKVQRETQNNS